MSGVTKKPLEWTARALDDFAAHPGIGTPGRRAGTREWPVKDSPLTLVYRVLPEKIAILAVVHQRANYRG